MTTEPVGQLTQFLLGLLSPNWVKATLVLSLLCCGMVIALCAYLNRWTKKLHYLLWTAGWLSYAVYLVVALLIEELGLFPGLIMARLLCIGMSALFMLWGVWELTQPQPRVRLIACGAVALVLWSFIAAYLLPPGFWTAAPIFLLLATSSICAGLHYARERNHSRPANILTGGFILWGVHLVVFSFFGISSAATTISYAGSAILTLTVAMGLIAREEAALSEQKYRGLLDNADHAIVMVDLWTLKLVDANQQAHRLTKRAPGELIGCPITELCPDLRKRGDNLLDIRNMFNAVFRENTEFHVMCADGSHVLCEGQANLCQWSRRPVFQIDLREASKRGKASQMIRRAEKLSSLGRLIAGVAHELNNPLAVVVGYAQLMCKHSVTDPKMKETLVRVLHESERASKIVRDLLSFARPCEPQLAPVSIGQLVCNVLDVREPDLRNAKVQLESSIPPNLPMTMADAIQIEQVLNNLITNAIHALANQPPEERTLTVTVEETSIFIRIMVSDNGPGISPANQEKIFEPFFTTKAPGKGTGLGLSISSTIMQEHHGRIWMESEVAKGARFFVELPIVACPLPPERPMPASTSTAVVSAPDKQRLLIVDDEPGIREVLQEILNCDGYAVETAGDGKEALERISATSFDLIISDLCMPGMDGETLYKCIRERDEHLADRVIFVTGDTVSPKSRGFLDLTGSRWLSKPFNIKDVENIVADCLQERTKSLTLPRSERKPAYRPPKATSSPRPTHD